MAKATTTPVVEATSKIEVIKDIFNTLNAEEALQLHIEIHNNPFLYHIVMGGVLTEKPESKDE